MHSNPAPRGLVAQHTIRYEIWQHRDIADGKQIVNGFDLELHGTHDHGRSSLSPGCEHCWITYEELRRIAESILPAEQRLSDYEIPPFDNSLHWGRAREGEVVLTIHIKHRHEYFTPIDDCEQRCLGEMVDKLRELGISGGRGSGVSGPGRRT